MERNAGLYQIEEPHAQSNWLIPTSLYLSGMGTVKTTVEDSPLAPMISNSYLDEGNK